MLKFKTMKKLLILSLFLCALFTIFLAFTDIRATQISLFLRFKYWYIINIILALKMIK